ncbi:MAG: C4-type zinc ribbon domain-containing protein [Omnitrophica bacterium]|nr:C4-type zinc ribbon domain-containing protein [Candidatus Omnitrophota bacterium]
MEKIQEQIDILIKLQELDAQLYQLAEEKVAKPTEKQALEEEFSQKKEGIKAKEDAWRSLQLKRKDYEMDLETKEKEIKKYQGQLYQIKNNKEYTSLQKQIEGLKADNAVLEDDILALMEKIDVAKTGLAGEKDNIAAEEKNLKQETAKIDQEIKEIETKISSLEKDRSQLSANVEKGLLSRYERILKAKRGLALVAIVGESCGGCNRVLPPQIINETRIKDEIITCDFCSRLLYWSG